MGTTRIKVIDLSSDKQEIKTSRKHAEKLAGPTKKETRSKDEQTAKPEVSEKSQAETAILEEAQTSGVESATPEVGKDETPQKKTITKKTARRRGEKYEKAKKLVEDKPYSTTEAFEILPQTSYVKFDPAVEAHLSVSEKNLRGSVSLPHFKSTVKKERTYLVFTDKKPQSDNKNVVFADEKTIEKIEKGELKPGKDFDAVIAAPKFMAALAKVAKILGPRGMMPNPKNGTVTEDVQKFLEETASKVASEFKTDPSSPIIHIKIGNLSQKSDELSQNLKALTSTIGHSKIKKVTLTTTMGPAIRIDTATL